MNNLYFTLADAAAPAAAPAAEATAAVETVAAEGAPSEGAPAQQSSGLFGLAPMLIILALFYFMMIRPQQRKEKERRKMIDELRAGAKIIFAGGLIGVIKSANERTFIVTTNQGEIEILRSSVNGVVAPGAEPAEVK